MKHVIALFLFCAATLQAADLPVLDAKDIDGIKAKDGTEIIVEGVVTTIGTTQNNSITFLNMGAKKQSFVAVVFQSDYTNFPDGFDRYKNQMLRVRGFVSIYKGDIPQIKVSAPDQISIVSGQ